MTKQCSLRFFDSNVVPGPTKDVDPGTSYLAKSAGHDPGSASFVGPRTTIMSTNIVLTPTN